MQLVLISGYSGSGKSVALNTLEDEGFYCVDNLPTSMLPALIERLDQQLSHQHYTGLAVGVDARSDHAELSSLPGYIDTLRQGERQVRVVFLRANEETLLRRFSETRRKHPLSDNRIGLRQAIEQERELLAALSDCADLVIDTSALTLHALRRDLITRVSDLKPGQTSLLFQSFGFKRGTPPESDFVFDVRCLPNPHWRNDLRGFTGQEEPVQDFLRQHDSVAAMEQGLRQFLELALEAFANEDRAYLTVSIGCTGGKHRSVYIADALHQHFQHRRNKVVVRHRDILTH